MAKKLKCSKCDKTFAMPAHLARHFNATHKPGGAAKKTAATKAKRPVGRPKGSGRKAVRVVKARGSSTTTNSLLMQAQANLAELKKQREALNNEIAAVDTAIKALRKA